MLHSCYIFGNLFACACIEFNHLKGANHRSQEIVEIVCNASGQASDRFELLGLEQFISESFRLSDVNEFTENARLVLLILKI